MKRRIVDYALPCPDCDGDGTVLVEVTGGRFNSHEQQWFPAERLETCDTCSGSGTVYASDMDWLDSNGRLDFRNAVDNYSRRITRHDVRRIYEQPRRAPSRPEQALPF